MIQDERIKLLNDRPPRRGDYVLYWMQQAQRVRCNHALEYAVGRANEANLPLVVFFGLTGDFPEANERSYYFMLEGLAEVREDLENRGIPLLVRHGSPGIHVLDAAVKASLVVTDRGYLDIQRRWREEAAGQLPCPLIQVESDVIVPIETVSQKEEYAAATIRKKIHKHLSRFLVPLPGQTLNRPVRESPLEGLPIRDIPAVLERLQVKRDVPRVTWLRGGTSRAESLLRDFIAEKLGRLDTCRNDPSEDCLSHLGPYLHFGQVSPLFVALKVLESGSPGSDIFLEELCVRRELSMNFVYFNDRYDRFDCLPEWARRTLHEHRQDPRPYIYTPEQLENARSHDPYWNAAQEELLHRGKMHGYMRMYWGKKVLEWMKIPEEAFAFLLYLNNKYSLDGRDANGYTGVAWCFGKHDRPWAERAVFGKVRYMNARGLERKFSIDKYVTGVKAYVKL